MMKWVLRAYVASALVSMIAAATVVALDVDHDGIDDMTGELAPSTPTGNFRGSDQPVDSILVPVPGISCATWESDGVTPALNGATGYLWVGSFVLNTVYKIDTMSGMIVATYPLPVNVVGLGWSGQWLLVHDNTGWVVRVDPNTGAIVDSVASASSVPLGICWKADIFSGPDQYMWQPDRMAGLVHQVRYFTNISPYSFPTAFGPQESGCLTDGWRIWTSDPTTGNYYQYGVDGVPRGNLYVGGHNPQPQDGTWDGHHLWDVMVGTPNSWAFQWDLWSAIPMYEVTICANPKYTKVAPGDSLTIWIGIKNHTATNQTIDGRLEVYRNTTTPVLTDGPKRITLAPGAVINYPWRERCPAGAPLGIYKVRVWADGVYIPSHHEDWCVVEVDP